MPAKKRFIFMKEKGWKGKPFLTFYFVKITESEHGFVNKFWRRSKLLGLDLPFGSLKPHVIFYLKCLLSVSA